MFKFIRVLRNQNNGGGGGNNTNSGTDDGNGGADDGGQNKDTITMSKKALGRRLERTKRDTLASARETLLEDEAFVNLVYERVNKNKPTGGAKPDPDHVKQLREEIARSIEKERVKPIEENLTKAQREAQTFRQLSLIREVESAASGFGINTSNRLITPFLTQEAQRFVYDEEEGGFFLANKDGELEVDANGEFITPRRHIERLLADKEVANLLGVKQDLPGTSPTNRRQQGRQTVERGSSDIYSKLADIKAGKVAIR